MTPRRRAAALLPGSTIGAIACGVMAGELLRDITQRTEHFRGHRALKILCLAGMLWFVAMESEKVLRHLDNAILSEE